MNEHAVAQPQRTNTPHEAAKAAILLQRRDMNQAELSIFQERWPETAFGTFTEPRIGYDFSSVPALISIGRQTQPLLYTQNATQGILKNEEDEDATVAEPTAETPAPEAITGSHLIVEDLAETIGTGQMRKSEFLAQLRAEVASEAETALTGTGRTTAECPYLKHWFGYYSRQDSLHLERAIRKYSPETAYATTARDYIPIIAERVRRSVEAWARTGEITGIPEGLSLGMGLVGGVKGLISSIGSISFKDSNGGARAPADPLAVQAELGEGQHLESAVRYSMESAFGMDFAQVRTHTDSTAGRLSDHFNARAFTVGEHVAFGTGEYKPGTIVGDALIAHELAHVVQQGGAYASSELMQVGVADHENLEAGADESALGAVASLWSGTKETFVDVTKNTTPRLRSGLRLQRCATSRTVSPTPERPANREARSSSTAAGPCGQNSKARTYTPTDMSSSVTLDTNEFGTTSKLAAQFSLGACLSEGNWRFYLDTFTVQIGSAVQPIGFRTNVDSATDSVVTRNTYQAIMNDLRPNRTMPIPVVCGGNRWVDTVPTYSTRRVYWKRQLVVDHEAFHRRDWDSMYRPELIRAEEQLWAHNIPENAARSASDAIQQERSSLDSYMIAAYQNTCRAYSPQQETRAYNDGAPRYQSLVDAIQSRARSENW
jgi:hypothetical protein